MGHRPGCGKAGLGRGAPWGPAALFSSFLLQAPLAHAAFQTPLTSVRSASMGSASMAGTEEAPALFMNPAGLAGMGLPELSFMYQKLHTALGGVGHIGAGYIAFAQPTSLGTIGVGMGHFLASGLKEERTLGLSLAKPLGRIRLGLTAKHFHHGYAMGSDPLASRDPVFKNGSSKSAFSMDIGLIATLSGPFKLGLAVRNLNQPDVGLATEDRVPREFQGGLSLDIGGIGLKATGDLFIRENGFGKAKDHYIPALGVEKLLKDGNVAMRLGATPLEFTGGVGIRFKRMGLDYGLVINRNMMQNSLGSHRLGMSYRFGIARKHGLERYYNEDSQGPEKSYKCLSGDQEGWEKCRGKGRGW